jgi:hypothetical protein
MQVSFLKQHNNMEKFLTKARIQEIINNAPDTVSSEEIISGLVSRGYQLEGLNVQEPVEEKKNIAEKIASVTGGEELGQGLGQAIAMGKNNKQIEKVQEDQFSIQGQLIQSIQKKRALGEDTSRLENALAMISDDISKTGEGAEKILNPNELTDKQVIGDALQLGTTVASVGSFGKGFVAGGKNATVKNVVTNFPGKQKLLPSAVSGFTGAKTIGQGIVQGAKTGALTGSVAGGATGFSQGLQEDKTVGESLVQGVKGAVVGGVTGGIVGGVAGGVSGAINKAKITKQSKYLDAVTPNTKDLTPTEYEGLLNRKKITPKTAKQPSKYILSDQEKAVASKYKGILTDDPVKNTQNIIDEIAKKDEEVGVFLKKNNGIFNTGELKNSIKKKLDDIVDFTVDDKKLSTAKKALIDNFVKELKKNDMETLWQARKAFDKQIEKAFSGSPTLQNNIKKEFRNAVQDFIADRTPDGVYKASMKDMSQLFNLRDITNTKAVKEKGLSGIQLWIKNNPTKVKVIGGVAGTGLLTGIGASILKN